MSTLQGIYAGLKLVSGPDKEPITLADAKSHLHVTATFDDSYINLLISCARQYVENVMRRALVSQEWRLSLKNWPGRDFLGSQGLATNPNQFDANNHIKIPLPPLLSVTSINYIDTSGNLYTMPIGGYVPPVEGEPSNLALPGGYNVFTDFEPGRIYLPFSEIWPTVILLPGAPIQITFVAGFEDLDELKNSFEGYTATIHAMKMLIGFLYEHRIPPTEVRKGSVPAGLAYVVEEMLEPYRVMSL